jgi:hypothetical protein
VLYLPYHLANLLARLMGRPLALLEISAWLHLSAAALVAYAFAPAERERERLGWAMVAMLMPGPLLLGLNWHNYLSCYPWFLALAFLLRRSVRGQGGSPGRKDRLLLGGLSLGFFLSAHAQMYVLGVGLLALWVLAEAPGRAAFRVLLPFLVAQLPALFPLVFMKLLAMNATADWMGGRDDPGYLLGLAQTLGTALHGTVLGNLLYTGDFRLWAQVSWTGVGMFFSPCLVLLARPLWRERHWTLGVFFLACLVFLGAASFPWVRFLGSGPLEGFRWTWKLSIFVGPLALVSLMPRLGAPLPCRFPVLPWLVAALSALVFFRGLDFELWPSLTAAHALGAAGLVEETRHMARETGLRPGTRVAVLGPFNMVQPLPLPVLGLVGNAPILSGLATASVYEPLEPQWVSQAHYGLSLPWRGSVPAQALLKHPTELLQALGRIGVQAVVTLAPQAAAMTGSRSYTDRFGRTLWVVPLPDAPSGLYPGAQGAFLAPRPSGVLWSPPSPRPPDVLTPRPLAWRQNLRLEWLGTPEGVPWGWALATILATLGALGGLLWKGWPGAAGKNLDP